MRARAGESECEHQRGDDAARRAAWMRRRGGGKGIRHGSASLRRDGVRRAPCRSRCAA
ncbi:hypothetical protein GLE_2010 [Lysobacter enzymogenes]|uniref:Uncharacterized protein n=1 Tax=Lysobacter enzymogenes TaxID=69 RepID=A0A0S2DFY6_LYSEN|nr:hypothetical protein GLE_2010 [Lysobacter enzymogenes]